MLQKVGATIVLILMACSIGRQSNRQFISKNIYEKLRLASIEGNEKEIRYPSGLVFAVNFIGPNDTDQCYTSMLISRSWAAVGSKSGFTNKILFSKMDWQSDLLRVEILIYVV